MAINIKDGQNGSLRRGFSWLLCRKNLPKKDFLDQSTELLEGQGNKAKVPNPNARQAEHGVHYINFGEDDQMEIYGYHRDVILTTITWFFICLTVGLLRLVFHWSPHWWLYATHRKCNLIVAHKVLVVEAFQKEHKCYHVKDIISVTGQDIEQMEKNQPKCGKDSRSNEILSEVKQGKYSLRIHTSGGKFKEIRYLRMFVCKKLRYVWDWDQGEFRKLRGLDKDVHTSLLHQQKGLSFQEQYLRRLVYGDNEITIPIKSLLELILLEVLSPFYMFQFFSFILWFADNYFYYAMAILTMTVFGISMSVIQTRRNLHNLQSTVHSSDIATVIRGAGGKIETVSTDQLVPGDLLVVPSHGCVMHCDAVLLAGTCIVNESTLTGESVPVTKSPIPNVRETFYDKKEHARHTLFCGTRVIQTRYYDKEKVVAVVVGTGFSTSKGGLVRSIMYPPPVDFKFERDSYKFVQLLAAIASVGFIYTVFSKMMRGVSAKSITLQALDLITVVVPPALPAAMTVGRMYAQSRLEKKNVFCITPRCINVSGSIDCVCFDKTGTLTEDGMDMWGVVPVYDSRFHVPVKNIETMATNDELCRAMVTCHSLTIIEGKLSGDPLDLKMFESTKWDLEEPKVEDKNKYDMIIPVVVKPPKLQSNTSNDPPLEIAIIRECEFSSSLQRMSVITRVLGASKFVVYCKGSPEMIVSLCHPQTDFQSVLEEYTQQGYRVLAVASKVLSGSYVKIQRMQRDDVESGLRFLGLVVMENRLKRETRGVISELRNAHIRTIMVTGDNIQTASSVARDCNIIPPHQSVIVVHGVPAVAGQQPQLYFTQSKAESAAVNGGGDASILSNMTNSNSLQSLATIESGSVTLAEDNPSEVPLPLQFAHGDFCLALTGKTWSIIKIHFPELVPRIVTRGTVFARMSPDQKQQLVQELQNLGYYVAMCGDGANDCGALKAAHVGISLSEAEASVASPFTSKTNNISCVPNVIREGRAALVTSFGIFKYMATYSLCQFVSVMILYSIDSNLSDIQYLFIDLFMITIFAFFFGRTEAYEGPLVKRPPSASLISLSPVISLIVQMIVVITLQTASFYQVQQYDWFKPYDANTSQSVGCYENYVIFSTSSFQYIILAGVFSKGRPYRKPICSNYGMLLSSMGMIAFTIYLVVSPAEWIAENFELVLPPDMSFRIIILIYAGINFILATLIETLLIEYYVEGKWRHKFHNMYKSHRKYLLVERELSQNRLWPKISSQPPTLGAAVLSPNASVPRSPATITEICPEFNYSRTQGSRQRLASTCGVTLDPGTLCNVTKRRTISDSEKECNKRPTPLDWDPSCSDKPATGSCVEVVNEVCRSFGKSNGYSTNSPKTGEIALMNGVKTIPECDLYKQTEKHNGLLNGTSVFRDQSMLKVYPSQGNIIIAKTSERHVNGIDDIGFELNNLPS